MVALLIGTAQAANRFGDTYHEIQIEDETGRIVEDINNLYIYLAGTTTDATIYMDKNRQNTITIPMTEASTNTTLVNGVASWWGPDAYDFSMTNGDGVGPMTNSGHADRNSAGGTLVFPSYLASITTAAFDDDETITMGTGADWVFQGGNVANQLSFTPLADDSTVNFGVSGTAKNTNFNVFTGASLGFKLSSSGATHSLTYDGGIVNLNPSSNFAVNICTGTSSGATTIGNSAGGAVSIDTDSSYTINADDASTIKTSAGTLLIEVTGGDLTIDSPDKSILIDSGESATDAIIIAATGGAGGVELVSGTGDITLDSGDDIFLEANTGIGDVISIINTGGTNASALIIRTVAAGSIDIDSGDNITVDVADDYTLDTAEGKIHLIADGTTAGDITLDAEDDIILITTGSLTITNTDAATISGALTVSGVSTLSGTVAGLLRVTELVVADDTITTAESGTVFIVENDADGIVLTLPAVAAGDDGMWFTVMDVNATAASDVTVEPGTGDSISDGAANEGFSSDGADKIPCAATFIYHHSTTTWYVEVKELDTGTAAWAPDGS